MFCPDCGHLTLRVIEEIPQRFERTEDDEYKQVCTCDDCENMVHIFRGI